MSQLSASGGQKFWSFSFSISPSNEHPGLISFRMDWLDLLAVQGTLTSLLQHHSSKAPLLRHSAFFIVQFSHLYTINGKTTALTRRTFVSKVMFLLFNMLSMLVIAFHLTRSLSPRGSFAKISLVLGAPGCSAMCTSVASCVGGGNSAGLKQLL